LDIQSTIPDREAAALSCLLQSAEAREQCVHIAPDSFEDTSAALVYTAIRHLHQTGGACTTLLVIDYIAELAGKEKAAALSPFLSYLDGLVANPAAEHKQHIARFREAASLRDIRNACIMAAEHAIQPGVTMSAVAAYLDGRLGKIRAAAGAAHHGLVGVSMDKAHTIELPPEEWVIEPMIATKHSAMVFGPRGCGKTWVSLGIAAAAASGKPLFGRWTVPKPHTVCYIDGEMGWSSVSKRASQMLGGIGCTGFDECARLHILADELQTNGIPSILDESGQARIDAYLDEIGAELVIVDNLSALAGARDENDAAGLEPVLSWMRRQKRKGRATVIVHHAGKDASRGGRGTSRLEDPFELIMSVTKPKGYKASDGATMDIKFTKARHLHGADVDGLAVTIDVDAVGRATARTIDPNDLRDRRIAELKEEGYSQREIAAEVGCDHTTVGRILKKMGL